MRSPEQVLKALNKHGKVSDYKFERLYRILFNEEMFHVAYQRIYAKPGNMTPGTDGKTINRMSLQRINKVIASLRDESYKPNPAKRIYIPKKNGKKSKSGKTKRSTLQKRRVSKSTKTTRTKKSGEPGPSLHDQSPPLFSHLNTI